MISTVIQTLSVVCSGLGKISIGATLLRIISRRQKVEWYAIWFVIISTAIITLANVNLALFRCGNPQNLWSFATDGLANCLNAEAVSHFNVFATGWQALSDVIFSALPVRIVWGLKLPVKRRLLIIGGLGLTLFTAAAALAKTIELTKINPEDFTFDFFDSLILVQH
ncbi:hypothetical protein F5Y16DRAFT_1962 [Xylariaceae sp. FL0255]|nr:hypothetical protein F5Y16DRAFT_1962 [Xylariaceae sp. FL0255]